MHGLRTRDRARQASVQILFRTSTRGSSMHASTAHEYSHIRIEHETTLTWIVLNRPDRANALSNEMLDEISHALEWLKDNGGPVLAFRGEGNGFSSGYDVGQVAAPKAVDPIADRHRLQRNIDRYLAIWDHPKPIIAAVHGYCIAGASQLVSLTDITIVTEDAKIGQVPIPMGAGYTTPLWVPLVGPKRAKEIAFVPGNSIDGLTAVEWGWANHAVPQDLLLPSVRSLAERIALTPPDLLAIKKRSINRAMESMGMRQAVTGAPDADALAHTLPTVHDIRARIAEEGLKSVLAHYRVDSTMDLSDQTAGEPV
jgi:enoyl-CoA hydratase